LYLAVVMELFSRKIVGWATRPAVHRGLVLNAVMMAVKRRRPNGTVIHSEQGCQCGRDDWRRFCQKNRLEPSMSRRGNCSDNAVAESFLASREKYRTKKRIYNTRGIPTIDVSESFYYPRRRAAESADRCRPLHYRSSLKDIKLGCEGSLEWPTT
jgi:putative transposase